MFVDFESLASDLAQKALDVASQGSSVTGLRAPIWTAGDIQARLRNHSYVSAWCRSDDEKNHMWYTYGDPSGSLAVVYKHSVILKAILECARSKFSGDTCLQSGRIEYVDDQGWDDPTLFRRALDRVYTIGERCGVEHLFIKSNIFEGDREFRFVVFDRAGVLSNSDLDLKSQVRFSEIKCSDAEKIVVGPSESKLLAECIEKLCVHFGSNVPVERSRRDLLELP